MHLEGDGACAGLAFAGAGGVLTEVGEIFAPDALREVLLELFGAAVIDEDLEMHLGLAAEFIDISLELALVGTDGLAKDLIVAEYSSKPERKDCGVLKTVRDNAGVIHPCLLIQVVVWVVFTHDDCEVAGGI